MPKIGQAVFSVLIKRSEAEQILTNCRNCVMLKSAGMARIQTPLNLRDASVSKIYKNKACYKRITSLTHRKVLEPITCVTGNSYSD